MKSYILSLIAFKSGVYRLHKKGCPIISDHRDHISLGTFDSSQSAYASAILNFGSVAACPFCLKHGTNLNHEEKPMESLTHPKQIQNTPEQVFFAGIN